MLSKAKHVPQWARAPDVSELYTFWTGDRADGLKQAEHIAWRVEEDIFAGRIGAGGSMGSERDLAQLFGAGLGATRQALEILDLRGVCASKRGPGGGIFVTQPSLDMTAQLIVYHLLRGVMTANHMGECKKYLDVIRDHEQAHGNPALQLLCSTFDQLEAVLGSSRTDSEGLTKGRPKYHSRRGEFRWQPYGAMRLSTAKRVAWSISKRIIETQYQTQRLGSEWDLRQQYSVSSASMRQATRLLEAFGIIDSQPGRGRGISLSPPDANVVIRAVDSYLLAVRMSTNAWREAMMVLGSAAIRIALNEPDGRHVEFFKQGKLQAESAKIEGALSVGRELLSALIARIGNPLIELFWRAVAGFAFRAFDATHYIGSSHKELIASQVTLLFDCAARGDNTGSLNAYMRLFPTTALSSWT